MAALLPAQGPADAPSAVPQDLSAPQLEALLEELVEQYKGDCFQEELAAAQREAMQKRISPLMLMGPVALKVQAPLLQKYGLPPNSGGVDLMKHAVHRRVAEGGDRVEELANEARRILSIDPMPDRHATTEEVMTRKVDDTSRRFGVSTPEAKAEIDRQCRAKVASSGLPSSSVALLEHLLDDGTPTPVILCLLKMAGLGMTTTALGGENVPASVPVLEAPSAHQFFQEHVLPNRPAVLRNGFDMDSFPPITNFPDLDYLRRRCGHRRVAVKSLGHDDRDGRKVFVTDPELKIPLVAFLENIEAFERGEGGPPPFYVGKIPLRVEMPELAEDVERASASPQKVYGDCFGPHINQGVFTYFGCGRNTTAVHFDVHENLQICLCGTKRFWLFPPSDAKYLYPVNDFSRSAVVPFTHHADLSNELQLKYGLQAKARPLEVTIRAGEMLYLPSCWWHCVEGSEGRNMTLIWWFHMHADKKALATAHSVS